MIVLGLDYGEKRIGVAVSDELHFMAHPHGFIANRRSEDVIKEIKRFVERERVQKIVVGMPATLKGGSSAQTKKVAAFVSSLKESDLCEVTTWDERLTTAEAEKWLIAQDVSRKRRRLKQDALAAVLILQSYLDFVRQQGNRSDTPSP